MSNSRDFIDSIENGENLEAESHFSSALSDKVGASLENRRQELANELVNEKMQVKVRRAGQGSELDAGSGRNERDKVADQARKDREGNLEPVTKGSTKTIITKLRTAGQPKGSDELDATGSGPKIKPQKKHVSAGLTKDHSKKIGLGRMMGPTKTDQQGAMSQTLARQQLTRRAKKVGGTKNLSRKDVDDAVKAEKGGFQDTGGGYDTSQD